MNFEVTYTRKDGVRELAVSNGECVVLTRKNPAYAAKNRYGMPEEISLSWVEFVQYFRTNCCHPRYYHSNTPVHKTQNGDE